MAPIFLGYNSSVGVLLWGGKRKGYGNQLFSAGMLVFVYQQDHRLLLCWLILKDGCWLRTVMTFWWVILVLRMMSEFEIDDYDKLSFMSFKSTWYKDKKESE